MATRFRGIRRSPNGNKKVRNATSRVYDNIKFRSQLEIEIYKALAAKHLHFTYEQFRAKIWDAKHFTVPYFNKVGKKPFGQITTKPICVHYTPDFLVKYKEWWIFLEVKGKPNDVFPYKVKLFREWLEKTQQQNPDVKYCYAVIYSKKDLETLLKLLDNG